MIKEAAPCSDQGSRFDPDQLPPNIRPHPDPSATAGRVGDITAIICSESVALLWRSAQHVVVITGKQIGGHR